MRAYHPMLLGITAMAVGMTASATRAQDNLLPLLSKAIAAGETKAAPAAATVEPLPAVEKTVFSYGENGVSVMFMPDQIDRMKQSLEIFENKAASQSANAPSQPRFTDEPEVQTQVAEPPSYPVFYLTTILYRGPTDWSIWVSGFKITSQKNNTDLTVLSVSKDSVTMAWKPSFADAFNMRVQDKSFADTGALKHRLFAANPVKYDPDTGMVTFTLRQNQAFSVGHFSIFEGYVEAPVLKPLLSVASETSTGATPTSRRAKQRGKRDATALGENIDVRNMMQILENTPKLPRAEEVGE